MTMVWVQFPFIGSKLTGSDYPLRRCRWYRKIYTLITQIPRFIVGISFACDVIIFQHFYYLYIALPILIIPLTFNIFYYVYKAALYRELVILYRVFDIEYFINDAGYGAWNGYLSDKADQEMADFGRGPTTEEIYSYIAENFYYSRWVDENVIDVIDKAHLYPIYKNFTILNLSLYLNGWLYIFIGILNAP